MRVFLRNQRIIVFFSILIVLATVFFSLRYSPFLMNNDEILHQRVENFVKKNDLEIPESFEHLELYCGGNFGSRNLGFSECDTIFEEAKALVLSGLIKNVYLYSDYCDMGTREYCKLSNISGNIDLSLSKFTGDYKYSPDCKVEKSTAVLTSILGIRQLFVHCKYNGKFVYSVLGSVSGVFKYLLSQNLLYGPALY